MKLPINTPPMKNDTHISHRCQTHPISPAEDLATNGRHIFGACTLVIHVYLDKPIWIHRNGGEHLASCENPRTKLNSSSRTAILFKVHGIPFCGYRSTKAPIGNIYLRYSGTVELVQDAKTHQGVKDRTKNIYL